MSLISTINICLAVYSGFINLAPSLSDTFTLVFPAETEVETAAVGVALRLPTTSLRNLHAREAHDSNPLSTTLPGFFLALDSA